MNKPSYIPENYNRIAVVDTMSALFNARVGHPANCIVFPRRLSGDFDGFARKLEAAWPRDEYAANPRIFHRAVQNIRLTPEETKAADIISCDIRDITDAGFNPVIRVIRGKGYMGKISNVLNFHTDTGVAVAESVLVGYNREPTRILRNDEAVLQEGNLYRPVKGAIPFSFHLGDVWRQADTRHPSGVPALIHAAPEELPDEAITADTPPRLLLVARYRHLNSYLDQIY